MDSGDSDLSSATTIGKYRQIAQLQSANLTGDYRLALANNVSAPDVGALAVEANAAQIAERMHDEALAAGDEARLREMGSSPENRENIESLSALHAMASKDWAAAIAHFDTEYLAAAEAERRSQGWEGDTLAYELSDLPLKAYAEAKMGRFAAAGAALAKLPRGCDPCMRARGRIAALEHRYGAAAYWFALVAARSPDIPFADTDWGEMLLRRGDYDAAIAKFASAHAKGPHFADPLEMWGEALIAKNRSDLALAKFEEAAQDAPDWGRLHLKWGEALMWSGHRNAARTQFAIAARLFLTPVEKAQLARAEAGHG